MRKDYLFIIGVIIGFVVSFFLFINNLIEYFIIAAVVTVVLIISFVLYLKNNRSPEDKFKSTLNNILKTFDGILISTNNIPKLEGKNIILVDTMQDIIDAQAEIRKPIYYKKTVSSCSFILLDTNEACIYTLRVTPEVDAPIDQVLDEIRRKQRQLEENTDASILEGIEKTTIVKLSNNKSYKISPMRKKQEEIEIL